MQSAYMCYYEHLAKLSRVANKQTMFLAHLLYRMEFEPDTKQWVVFLTPYEKRSIIESIGSETEDKNGLARQYLSKLSKAGLLKSIGGNAYLVDPKSFSGSKYIKKELRMKNAMIYETRVFTEDSEGEVQSYIITEDGERVDLS